MGPLCPCPNSKKPRKHKNLMIAMKKSAASSKPFFKPYLTMLYYRCIPGAD
ncbi:unnamed protein product [Staurois parvus]|uniref:Uncharacterized protein n=1 Tax=Staurois parvus TaxID=386267 RepID=A0ABN9H272_9NEOB|nr:unnamed protein product [Staurois parvus]